MPSWIWPAVVAFIVIDIVVTALVLRHVVTKGLRLGGLDYQQLRPLADAIHVRVGEYLRTHYGGRPEQLPEVLHALLPELREVARAHGMTPDDDTLKAALLVAVSSHGLANPRQVQQALAKVA